MEDPIISYKKIEKDENGKNIWVDAEFDIRNKTFSQFPKELQKKFYEYQVETVIHECDVEQAAKYLRRYNVHTAMNANEQLFIHIPKFADEIREIIQDRFFLDCTIIKEIEKAILASDIGITPNNDGKVIRLIFPELTEDRRKELVKDVKKKGENAKVAIRNIRRDGNDAFKKLSKSEDISEDEIKDLEDALQKLTDKYIANVEKAVEEKSKEILTV